MTMTLHTASVGERFYFEHVLFNPYIQIVDYSFLALRLEGLFFGSRLCPPNFFRFKILLISRHDLMYTSWSRTCYHVVRRTNIENSAKLINTGLLYLAGVAYSGNRRSMWALPCPLWNRFRSNAACSIIVV